MYELSSSIPVDLFLRSSYARWFLTTIPQAHRYDEHQDRDRLWMIRLEFIQSTTTILQAAQHNDTLAQLPIGIPDAIPKRT